MRDTWLAAIAAHVNRVEQEDGDALDPAMADVARDLVAVLGDGPDDLGAWHLLGRFHMHRDAEIYNAGEGGWEADNAAMMAAFARCLLAGPSKPDGLDVPADIRDGVAQHAAQMVGGLASRARSSGDPEAISAIPPMWQRVISALASDSPGRPALLANLGVALLNRFLAAGDVADLDAAVTVGHEAVSTAAANDPELPAFYFDLAEALALRFEQRGDRSDVDAAIASIERALELSPADHPARATYLSIHGSCLRVRFDHWGDRADLDSAVTACGLAVKVGGDAARPALLRNSAAALLRRFDETASTADLDNAIGSFRQALDLAPATATVRPSALSGLGVALRARFCRTDEARDLDEAVAAATQSVAEARQADPERPIFLDNLGTTLTMRAVWSGEPEEKERAVAASREAVAAVGTGHPLRGMFLSHLSGALQLSTVTATELAEAIALSREAVTLTPPGHPARGRFLMSLCGALLDLCTETDDPADADEAVSVGRQALDEIPEGHSARSNALVVLGEALRRQAGMSGHGTDGLDEAIAVMREAIAALPPGAARTEASCGLGVTLRQRFKQGGSAEDLAEAVTVLKEAASQADADTSDGGSARSDLATTLLLRYEHEADAACITDAVAMLRQALTAPVTDPDTPARYRSQLSEALRVLYGQNGERADIDEAVALSRQAVEMTPAGHPNLLGYQLTLGKALQARAVLAQGGDLPQPAAQIQAPDEAARSELAARLAALTDIGTTGELATVLVPGTLDDALRLADLLAADETPDLDAHAVLGRYFWLRYLALPEDDDGGDGDRADGDGDADARSELFAFSSAIDFYTPLFAAGRWVPDRLRPAIAEEMAVDALADLFDRVVPSADVAAPTQAIALWRRILDSVPADHPERGTYSGALGTALLVRHVLTARRTDLEESLAALGSAVAALPVDDPLLPVFRSSLSEALLAQSGLAGSQGNREGTLDHAVAAARQAVEEMDHTVLEPAEQASLRAQLGLAQVSRYRATGDQADLDAGTALLSEADAMIPAEAFSSPLVATALSEALYLKFAVTSDPALLDEAVGAARRAITARPDDPAALAALGVALRDRALLHGNGEDLTAGIDALTHAAQRAVPGSLVQAVTRGHLSRALLTRFTWTGEKADLDATIDFATQAAAVPAARSAANTGLDNTLAGALLTRFQQTGGERDLDAAITISREAAAALPPAHPDRQGYLALYATALQMRYLRTDQLQFLDESIAASRQLLAGVPDGHTNAALYQMTLAGSLRMRCMETETEAGLDEALELARHALASAPPGHAFGPLLQAELGSTLTVRFMFSEDRVDIDEAVGWLRKASADRAGQPRQADFWQQLAFALAIAHQQYGLPDYRDEALDLYARAAENAHASATSRIHTARLGALFAMDFAPSAASDLMETAVRLLPLAACRQLSRADQQHALGQFAFLSNEAAELALTAGGPSAPARALGLLELSRAVLQGQALDTRRDLLDLYAAYPALAGRFQELRDLLDAPDGPDAGFHGTSAHTSPAMLGPALTLTPAVNLANTTAADTAGPLRPAIGPDRFQAGAEFNALLDQIRGLSGFESFLLPPSPAELTRHADQGPVVAFNVGGSRCDALIVTPSEIELVPLHGLSGDELASRIDIWETALDLITDPSVERGGTEAAEESLSGVLEWLWDVAAEPVLRHLGYTGTAESGPRIWWAPGGFLGMLPIHAAGYHRARAGATVLDRAVSSYTPTVRALSYARERARTTPPARSLIVAMPTTPGADAPLPQVAVETDILARLLPSPTILIEEECAVTESIPTRDRVLAALADADIAHFACHAASHPDDPSRSQIFLHDHQDSPFTVATLLPARLRHAQLAFLSACQTARSEDLDLLDEAIHLTSAFQLAGFPHVIGTLWPIADSVSADVAVRFYERLQSGPHSLAVADSAQALHDTIQELRDRPGYTALPSLWAAHIHVGA